MANITLVDHVNNGEPVTEDVLRRPSLDLDANQQAINSHVETLDDEKDQIVNSFQDALGRDLSRYESITILAYYSGWEGTTTTPRGRAKHFRTGSFNAGNAGTGTPLMWWDSVGNEFKLDPTYADITPYVTGGVGDGVTDDTAAIQAIESDGSIDWVYLPSGSNFKTTLAPGSLTKVYHGPGVIDLNGSITSFAYFTPDAGLTAKRLLNQSGQSGFTNLHDSGWALEGDVYSELELTIGGVRHGGLYTSGGGNIGFRDTGGDWGFRYINNNGAYFYTENESEEFRVGINSVTGLYGTVQTSRRKNGWGGYSISGRVVFMHDNDTQAGIYDTVNNEWMIRGVFNDATELYYDGQSRLNTTAGGVNINGDLTSSLYGHGVVKKSLRFNGNGGGGVPVIYDSYGGISSVARTADGKYQVNFSTSMADSNYVGVGVAGHSVDNFHFTYCYPFTPSAMSVATSIADGTITDASYISVIVTL